MSKFIDLSHYIEDNMPGFKMKNEDGTFTQYTAKIKPFLTHEQTLPKFKEKCSFEITEMAFQTSVGTYLDSPYHRFPEGRDISEIKIEEVIVWGILIDARNKKEWESVGIEALPKEISIKNKAVLFNFGWDIYWGTEQYQSYPFISREVIDYLIKNGAKLVGVDTVNIDSSRDLERPAHTMLLRNNILIVENLMNLDQLYGKSFKFYAVPIKGRKVAAMPVRAFAEIL